MMVIEKALTDLPPTQLSVVCVIRNAITLLETHQPEIPLIALVGAMRSISTCVNK